MRWWVPFVVLAVSCKKEPPPETPARLGRDEPLLTAALAAHGGAERLTRLARRDVALSGQLFSSDTFTSRTSRGVGGALRSELKTRGLTLAVTVTADGGCRLDTAFGVEVPCTEDQRRGAELSEAAAKARLLAPLLDERVSRGATLRVGTVDAETLTWGDVELAFHPETHRLLAMTCAGGGLRLGITSRLKEVYSAYQDVEGALVPHHVEVNVDGVRWFDADVELSEPVAVAPPPRPALAHGAFFEQKRPRMLVAWAEHRGPGSSIPRTLHKLVDFANDRGLAVDPAGGIFLTALSDPGKSRRQQTELAVGLVPWDAPAVDAGGRHIATWPERHVAGVVAIGEHRDAFEMRTTAERELRKRGLQPVKGAHWRLVLLHYPDGTPETEQVSLLEIDVQTP